MLIRISLIVVIIAGLGVGALNFVQVKGKITTLMSERDTEKSQKEEAQTNLRKTTKDLERTTADLKQTKDDLSAAVTEKEKAVIAEAAATKRATLLADDLGKAKKDRDDALANLESYKVTGFTPPQILALGKSLKLTQDSLAESKLVIENREKKIASLNRELDAYRGDIRIVYLPATLKGKILVSDPKWDFVVLNLGDDQKIVPDAELLVSRDGKLVGKVIVRSVQKDRSIANLMPGWKIGEVLEGDQVIPAHPQS